MSESLAVVIEQRDRALAQQQDTERELERLRIAVQRLAREVCVALPADGLARGDG